MISNMTRAAIGISPLASGWPESCIGIEAISEISRVTTSSLV